ncbi:MAG: hypothetical protein IT431_06780 [Phycisphaerales bacterium]|nr:hypothetical protein [Phycisphaerales bacterium]
MTEGCFLVGQHAQRIDEIDLTIRSKAAAAIPDDQLSLCFDAQRCLTYLQQAFPDRIANGRLTAPYALYFNRLLNILRIGLTGATARPALGAKLLEHLKQEVAIREAARAKNACVRRLGLWCMGANAALLVCAMVVGLLADPTFEHPPALVYLMWLLAACMAGIWVSFVVRKVVYSFADIAVPEEDRLHPLARIVCVGLLAVAFALALSSGLVEIKIGAFDPAAWVSDVKVAVLFGFICGFNDQILAGRFGHHAQRVFG